MLDGVSLLLQHAVKASELLTLREAKSANPRGFRLKGLDVQQPPSLGQLVLLHQLDVSLLQELQLRRLVVGAYLLLAKLCAQDLGELDWL